MDKTTLLNGHVVRSNRFRQPSPVERALGLWVDRIGQRSDPEKPRAFRLLGQYAAVMIESGRGVRRSVTGKTIGVAPGDVILVFPDEPSAYEPISTWHTRWIVWGGPEAKRLESLDYVARSRPVVRGAGAEVSRVFFALAARMDAEDSVAALERKNAILDLVSKLCTAANGAAQASAAERLVAPIRDRPESSASIQEWAARHRMSPTHFRRLFRQHTGRCPQAFITEQRMARAKALLASGVSIKETAARVGYDDPLYFMRLFRRHVGETAGRFARANRG